MSHRTRTVAVSVAAAAALFAVATTAAFAKPATATVTRAAVPPGAIKHIVVIDLENEDFDDTFGPSSPATYLNGPLRDQGELIENYYATSHASLGNYISQVSGQASTPIGEQRLHQPGHAAAALRRLLRRRRRAPTPTRRRWPGQVVGDGCVYPAPTATSHGAQTIGDQLDAQHGARTPDRTSRWRAYAEDMGNIPSRDYGVPDPMGGTDCAHPPIGGVDVVEPAVAGDQYATRHVGVLYLHSVIDDVARCAAHVVPLGTVTARRERRARHLHRPPRRGLLRSRRPRRSSRSSRRTCATTATTPPAPAPTPRAGTPGGLVGADLWLKHWMPLILGSPAYQSGKMLVVVTFDEGNPLKTAARVRGVLRGTAGPELAVAGICADSWAVRCPGAGAWLDRVPGRREGGRAILLNPKYIVPGSVNATAYNHYSALRSYEDLLGITSGGDDGLGHLGFAAVGGLAPFGPDVFNARCR